MLLAVAAAQGVHGAQECEPGTAGNGPTGPQRPPWEHQGTGSKKKAVSDVKLGQASIELLYDEFSEGIHQRHFL